MRQRHDKRPITGTDSRASKRLSGMVERRAATEPEQQHSPTERPDVATPESLLSLLSTPLSARYWPEFAAQSECLLDVDIEAYAETGALSDAQWSHVASCAGCFSELRLAERETGGIQSLVEELREDILRAGATLHARREQMMRLGRVQRAVPT